MIQHEGESVAKVILEPLSEYFLVNPGETIEVVAEFESETTNCNFTVAPGDDCLVIYAPGEIAGFGDCYAVKNDLKLVPDGN